jgi:hypothetical protein
MPDINMSQIDNMKHYMIYIYIILIYIDIYTLAESDNNGLKQDMIRATVGVAHLFFPWLALHTKHFAHVKPSV